MDELDSLTDNELRLRLIQYGFENIPITITTRKTLIKKLRLAGSTLKKSKDLVTKYSSDEEATKFEPGKLSHKQKKSISSSFSRPTQPLSSPPPSTSFNTFRKSSNNSTKNIYVSPVYINDSDEEDNNSFGLKQSPSKSLSEDDATSNYTKRLLQLRRENIEKTTQQTKNRYMTTENGRAGYGKREINFGSDSPSLSMPKLKKKQDGSGTYGRHSLVSMLLVGFPIIFFTLIIFTYLNMSSDIENTMHHTRATFRTCENITELEEIGEGCIEEANIESSLKLLKLIASKLQQKTREIDRGKCNDQKLDNEAPRVCREQILEWFKAEESFHALEISKDLRNVNYLIDHNPSWGLTHSELDGEECFSAQLATRGSIICVFLTKLRKFFTIIGSLAVLGILYLAIRKFYYFTLAVKEKRRANLAMIVDEIFALLMEKAKEDSENPYLSVEQLKNKILTDKSLLSIWNEALSQLEQNEKRLEFGYENINGEDVKVIRWVDHVEENSSQQQRSSPIRTSAFNYHQRNEGNLKRWIGPAFDKCNKITPPTNCLKIRNMFDKYEVNNENLQTIIADTILLKVGKSCKIMDIQLDRKTCCVYVKCISCADAGIVHNEINGWWLDKRLVVVKFLKEEKFLQRFPNSNKQNAILGLSPNAHMYYNEERDSENEF